MKQQPKLNDGFVLIELPRDENQERNSGKEREYDDRARFKPIVDLAAVEYDFEALAREMEDEKLPPEFVQTIRTGWWTTCLEILPAKERDRGKF